MLLLSECCEVSIGIFSNLGYYLALTNLMRRMSMIKFLGVMWCPYVSKSNIFLTWAIGWHYGRLYPKADVFKLCIACTFPSIDVYNNKLSSCSLLNLLLPGLYLPLVSFDQLQSAHVYPISWNIIGIDK